ncbi:MAG TPA: class I SAM-dependent methyltransferase [Bacteroidales bacterium]|nr:class I SAM-dependent methyltransferase [Bacteroidales bacterium]
MATPSSPWYEKLFANYGKSYDKEIFTTGTIGECNFIEQEISFNKNLRILDVGCGTGRHAIELAKRGYEVTGIDLSESLLDNARQKAYDSGLRVDFLQMDARQMTFSNEFDVVIMICEGAFPLMETDEMNFMILQGISRALRPGGKLIFTTLNGLFPLFHSVEEFHKSNAGAEGASYHDSSFDLMTFRDHNLTRFTDDDGNEIELQCNERYYVPSEITWLLKSLQFSGIEIFGATLGAFSRQDCLSHKDFEMLVIATRLPD